MGKAWNYVIISMGLILLLQFAGLPNGATGKLFAATGVNFDSNGELLPVTTSASGFFNELFGSDGSVSGILISLGLAAGAAVVVGLFAKARVENLVLLPFITGVLVLFISSSVSIINYAIDQHMAWFGALITAIFIPYTIGFIMSLAEFFRGTD